MDYQNQSHHLHGTAWIYLKKNEAAINIWLQKS